MENPFEGAKITVGLRYDDFSALSPYKLERRILDACSQHQTPCTFGVIPKISVPGVDMADPSVLNSILPEKWELLRKGIDAGVLEVALHGFTHAPIKSGGKSEFKDLPLDRQIENLREGKAILEAAIGPVDTFIPPWNSYDAKTLQAMQTAGLTVLSAAPDGKSYGANRIRFVPATCLMLDLKFAVEHASHLSKGNPKDKLTVVGYFHPFDFKEEDSYRGRFTFQEFEGILKWLASRSDVQIKLIREIGAAPYHDEKIYRGYSRISRWTPEAWEKFLRPVFWAYPFPVVTRAFSKGPRPSV